MDKRFIASTVLKTVALIMFLVSLTVNLVTYIGDSTSTTSNVVVLVTLALGWILHGVDRIFVDKEED